MRCLLAIAVVLILGDCGGAASAHAGPFRRTTTTTRASTCVGKACAKAVTVTTAPVRVVRKVVGR